MLIDEQKMQSLQALRSQFSQILKDFASSKSSFRILRSIPGSPPLSSPISILFVLDSSFNPPSRAHSSLVKSALSATQLPNSEESLGPGSSHASPPPPRVLFLLATVNADKKPKPADFEDRLVMMTLMAEELRAGFSNQNSLSSQPQSQQPAPVIDIGITKEPYFIDKATSIANSNLYRSCPSPNSPEDDVNNVVEQVHIMGFDTLTRIFTSRYYPQHDPPLSALEPFLSRHRIHATIRVESNPANENDGDPESEFGTVEKQKGYLERLGRGALEDEGLKREWVDRVQLAVDESGEAEGVSSTSARECVKKGDLEKLRSFVGEGVKDWILAQGLYRE